MPQHHELKTHYPIYDAVRNGDKNYEVRKDDRAFQCGDTVELIATDPRLPPQGCFPAPVAPPFVNRPNLFFRIGFVLRGGQYGVEPGFVAFSLLPQEPK